MHTQNITHPSLRITSPTRACRNHNSARRYFESAFSPLADLLLLLARHQVTPTMLIHHHGRQVPNENQDFVEEKFKELDSDQIEGAEFEFLGLETRFKRNKRQKS